MTSNPVKGHNKGPIGPLDSEPPWPWRRREVLPVAQVTRILREMGADIRDRDIEEAIAEGTGPSPCVGDVSNFYGGSGVMSVELGEAISWSQRTFRKEGVLTRKQATEYIRCLGYPISDSTLQQNKYGAGPKLRFVRPNNRTTYYTEEWCREWVEECRALGLSPGSFEPKKYKPSTKRYCPRLHEDCPNVPHEKCAKYARALCKFTRDDRPTDPKALAQHNVQASGIVAALWAGADLFWDFRKANQKSPRWLFQRPASRPGADAEAAYLAAWSSG